MLAMSKASSSGRQTLQKFVVRKIFIKSLQGKAWNDAPKSMIQDSNLLSTQHSNTSSISSYAAFTMLSCLFSLLVVGEVIGV